MTELTKKDINNGEPRSQFNTRACYNLWDRLTIAIESCGSWVRFAERDKAQDRDRVEVPEVKGNSAKRRNLTPILTTMTNVGVFGQLKEASSTM